MDAGIHKKEKEINEKETGIHKMDGVIPFKEEGIRKTEAEILNEAEGIHKKDEEIRKKDEGIHKTDEGILERLPSPQKTRAGDARKPALAHQTLEFGDCKALALRGDWGRLCCEESETLGDGEAIGGDRTLSNKRRSGWRTFLAEEREMAEDVCFR